MRKGIFVFFSIMLVIAASAQSKKKKQQLYSGNPVFPGWYADPEIRIFDNQYWIFPTFSDHYGQEDRSKQFTDEQLQLRKNTINQHYLDQTFLDAFSSSDLVHWKKHSHVLDVKDVKWAAYAMWAPSIVEANNKYFLFFSANDIQNNQQLGGIGVAVADHPSGPFKDYLGKPLINQFHNGAQPIDQFVFKDKDGQYYIIYGGWRHCNIAKLNKDFTGFIPFDDGTTFKEITPKGYVEGAFMFLKDNKYYFMWSEGGWMGPDYSVAYAVSDSPFGPFERVGKILQQDSTIATGAGHHSVLHIPGKDNWYIVYHRRPLGDKNPHHREVCMEEMFFDEKGMIRPVKLTKKGVRRQVLQ